MAMAKPKKPPAGADGDDEIAKQLAEKVGFLFETFKKPNGDNYTFREVAELTGLDSTWIWRLSKAQVTRPGIRTLKLLSDFFNVDPSFWFNDLTEGYKIKMKIEHGNETVQQIALRSLELPPEAQ